MENEMIIFVWSFVGMKYESNFEFIAIKIEGAEYLEHGTSLKLMTKRASQHL